MTSQEPIYISYSRQDVEFVRHLANDLRVAGANIFLDQNELQESTPWGSSIYAAVNSAAMIMVILSPYSVKSDFVMEEVSVALKSKKRIIPILFAHCEVPTQLKKLQMLDFTEDYRWGLIKLQEALGLRAPVPLAFQLIEDNKITKSPRLDLSNCGMNEIPEEIGELEWLEDLIIAGRTYYDFQFESIYTTGGKGEKIIFQNCQLF